LDLIGQGVHNGLEGGHVFDLCAVAKVPGPFGAKRNVYITTELPFFHAAITGPEIDKGLLQFIQVGPGLTEGVEGIAFVVCYDFQERYAGAIVVNEAVFRFAV